MDIISPLLRNDFREFCVNYLVLREINNIFTMAGVRKGILPEDMVVSGQRRTLVEEYYASFDWHNHSDVAKFLDVIGYALAQTYSSDKPRSILREYCERSGMVVDGIKVRMKTTQGEKGYQKAVDASTLAELKKKLIDINVYEPQQRGFEFERFLHNLFDTYGLVSKSSFRLVGEQIDGSFQLASDIYLLEAKWQSRPIGQEALLVFREKVESKSTWTRGLFVSVSGFSADGLTAFSRGRATNIIGMSGQDLYFILSGEISLREAIERKARKAAESGEFFVALFDIIRA